MAKGARASSIKTNNKKLKAKVFGPIEAARTERLSAKLLELASAPKPVREEPEKKDMEMDGLEEASKELNSTEAMELDQTTTEKPKLSKTQVKHRIERRKSARSKSSIVFPRHKDRKRVGGNRR